MSKSVLCCACLFLFMVGCKTSDSPQSETKVSIPTATAPVAPTTPTTSVVTTSTEIKPTNNTIDKETQHKFNSFVKLGDNSYAEGNYREALDFYKKAQNLAPDQLSNEKLIACLKAIQQPSTRRKNKN